nr:tRNA (adenosine(37)-N6)-threonylcarbamoyltransferase complex dimerization subunit type 1 TsaB [uncultured Rhodoferax sp.]
MNLLALDTGTEFLSIALRTDGAQGTRVVEHHSAGGAKASTDLIAAILQMLADAGLRLGQLDAICFGSGPGSFTGLRTACSVVQGLAFGAGVPVLPVDSLLAVAEDARFRTAPDVPQLRVTALLDARMDEMYAADYRYLHGRWQTLNSSALLRPEGLRLEGAPADTADAVHLLAGNVFTVYAQRLPAQVLASGQIVHALPMAAAMLRLAPALLAAGLAVDAAQAMPSYIRDKVAKTTAEREAEKAAAAVAAAIAP